MSFGGSVQVLGIRGQRRAITELTWKIPKCYRHFRVPTTELTEGTLQGAFSFDASC